MPTSASLAPVRRSLILSTAVLAVLLTASSASAAVLFSRSCNRYVPSLAGQKWVPVGATGGFAPGQSVQLRWSVTGNPIVGSAQADPFGRLFTGVFMPSDFIRSRRVHERTYGLSAFDTNTGAKAGLGRVRFVRVGFDYQSRRRPHQITRYGLWGGRAGRKVWLHFYFGGRQRKLVYMGRANKPCGVVHKRLQVLPTRSRYGKWTVYANNGSRTLSRRTIRRHDYFAYVSFTVFRVTVPRFRAAAAATLR